MCSVWSCLCAALVLAHHSEFQTTFNLLPLQMPVMATLTLFSCSARSKPAPSPQLCTLLNSGTVCPSGELCSRGQMGPWHGLVCMLGWSWETELSPRQFESASSTLFLGLGKHLGTLQEWSLGF